MAVLNFYVQNKIFGHTTVDLLNEIFFVSKEKVSDLYKDDDSSVAFEIRIIDDNAMFSTEVNVYTKPDIMKQSSIFNNLLLGMAVSKKLGCEVLVNDESDDPYQWILIDGGDIFLVEDNNNNSDGICINYSDKKLLDLDFALNILPNKENFDDEKITDSVYLISPSTKWNEGLF